MQDATLSNSVTQLFADYHAKHRLKMPQSTKVMRHCNIIEIIRKLNDVLQYLTLVQQQFFHDIKCYLPYVSALLALVSLILNVISAYLKPPEEDYEQLLTIFMLVGFGLLSIASIIANSGSTLFAISIVILSSMVDIIRCTIKNFQLYHQFQSINQSRDTTLSDDDKNKLLYLASKQFVGHYKLKKFLTTFQLEEDKEQALYKIWHKCIDMLTQHKMMEQIRSTDKRHQINLRRLKKEQWFAFGSLILNIVSFSIISCNLLLLGTLSISLHTFLAINFTIDLSGLIKNTCYEIQFEMNRTTDVTIDNSRLNRFIEYAMPESSSPLVF